MTQLSNVRVTDEQLAVWKAEAKRVMHHPATPMDIHCHAYATYVLATELQERRSAAAQEPVAVVDIQRGRGDGRKYALCYTSAGHSLPDDVYNLYAEPQPVAVPDDLLSAMEEVLRISDRDHEAWHRARDGIAAYRAAALQLSSGALQLPVAWVVSFSLPGTPGSDFTATFWSLTEKNHWISLHESAGFSVDVEPLYSTTKEPTK
ncbi:hypothetical protein ACV8AU_001125 [Escherichia coli]